MLHIFQVINPQHRTFVITLLNEPLSGSLVSFIQNKKMSLSKWRCNTIITAIFFTTTNLYFGALNILYVVHGLSSQPSICTSIFSIKRRDLFDLFWGLEFSLCDSRFEFTTKYMTLSGIQHLQHMMGFWNIHHLHYLHFVVKVWC